ILQHRVVCLRPGHEASDRGGIGFTRYRIADGWAVKDRTLHATAVGALARSAPGRKTALAR
ncbi:MAG TPA: hypothetical protein VFB50_17405, partial [Chloroflexota bacterium]|nr:hypothetical protein [Chloroflexota bacterium]